MKDYEIKRVKTREEKIEKHADRTKEKQNIG